MKPKWKLIATAPKDGSTIMVAVKDAQEPAFVFWDAHYGQWIPSEYEDLKTAITVCGVDWVLKGGPANWPITHWAEMPEIP